MTHKTFRGVPEFSGWLLLFISIAAWSGKRAHENQSITFGIIAIISLLLSIPGAFAILLWRNGFL